jgi:hypothetical protein
VHGASGEGAIDEGFATFAQRRVDALIIGNDAFLSNRKEQIFARAAQHAIPTIYYEREFAVAGDCYPMEPTLLIPIVRLASMSLGSSRG